jgi:prolyl oligopeptidase
MRSCRSTVVAATLLCFATSGGALAQQKPPGYPKTKKGDVVEEHFGVKVADPFRWLEKLDSPDTAAWISSQNAVTFGHLERLADRQAFRKRITELWDYPKLSLPFREAGRLFYRKNSGLQRQAVLYSADSPTSEPKLLIDPNQLSPDGSVALFTVAPSPDGRLLAYSLSEGGADWQTIHVRDLATGRDLPDVVRWMRFSDISWTDDGKGFFYSRYPEPPADKKLEAALAGHALYYHRVGTAQAEDRLVYERKDLPSWLVLGDVSEDGRYLFVVLLRGADPRNRVYYADLKDPRAPDVSAPIRALIEADDAEYWPFGNVGTQLFIRTDRDAPNRKVMTFDITDPSPAKWRTPLPEAKNPLENVTLAGGRLAAQYLVDVKSELRLYDLQGRELRVIPLPGIGSVAGLSARHDTPELLYAFTSALYPTSVFAYDLERETAVPFDPPPTPFDPAGYETKQDFATSKDGTRVPYFWTARKGLRLDGRNPTLLYAYGGFSASLTPTYSPDVPAWLERGGVYVTANLRGGAEYGEAWHRAGMLEKKQNVFDDFIAVAEDLVKRGITSSAKLAIHGGSNGGLLVGAAMTQRPDLFAVALPAVGVLDMLRYDKFTGGALWVSEYGSPTDPAAFRYLKAYSPLHNLKPGTCYPATLITTADHDDRVVPSHSFKFAAALQEAQACPKPVLIRVETKTSHGYRPTDKRIEELADIWTFTAANLGSPPRAARP